MRLDARRPCATAAAADKRELRDASTHLANAYSVVGNSDAIRDVMERLSTVDVPPDQHMFNALLRSEAGTRLCSPHV